MCSSCGSGSGQGQEAVVWLDFLCVTAALCPPGTCTSCAICTWTARTTRRRPSRCCCTPSCWRSPTKKPITFPVLCLFFGCSNAAPPLPLVVGQNLRASPDPSGRRARVDAAGAEGAALQGDHPLPGQGQGEPISREVWGGWAWQTGWRRLTGAAVRLTLWFFLFFCSDVGEGHRARQAAGQDAREPHV